MFMIIGGDGKEYGPVTADQVRAWIAAGRANLDTQAKAVGSGEWRRVGDFAEFSGAPLPPVMSSSGAALAADVSEPASRGARTGAACINAFFYLVCTMPGSMIGSRKLLQAHPELAQGSFPRMNDIDVSLLISLQIWVWTGILIGMLLQTILIAARGQNIGKMLVGVRVVRASDGQPAGFVRAALLRFVVPVFIMIVLSMLTVVLGFVFLVVDYCFMFREDGRCLHDLMAGTKVVRA
jgi:uncharacterized RDD family membrane protein YckC